MNTSKSDEESKYFPEINDTSVLISPPPVINNADIEFQQAANESSCSFLELVFPFCSRESTPIKSPVREKKAVDTTVSEFAQLLSVGVPIVIYTSTGLQSAKFSMQNGALKWQFISSTGDRIKRYKLAVRDIDYLSWGKRTQAFRTKFSEAAEEESCFSLIMLNGRTLDIEVMSQRNELAHQILMAMLDNTDREEQDSFFSNPNDFEIVPESPKANSNPATSLLKFGEL